MGNRRSLGLLVAVLLLLSCASSAPPAVLSRTERFGPPTELPNVAVGLDGSLTAAIADRRSTRRFAPTPLSTEIVGQLLWAAQGVTDADGHRAAPSAGARYPLEIYSLTALDVSHYLPDGHRIERRPAAGEVEALGDLAFGQEFVADAPLVLVIVGVVARTEVEYGALATDLVNREAGHAAQNILLQATALDLAAVPVGGFDPAAIAELLSLPPGEEPLYLVPIGHRP